MERKKALYFRDRFRAAREAAQKNAENFDKIIFALEQLGMHLCKRQGNGLGNYMDAIFALACKSSLAKPSDKQRPFCTPFDILFDLVRQGRNSAMHEGAYARHLTQHAIEISIVLEDAFDQIIDMPEPNMNKPTISDFMVRNPVCAEIWHPLSFIRQNMLANSFSYLPVEVEESKWKLVSDLEVSKYLRKEVDGDKRRDKLAKTLDEASKSGLTLLDAVAVKDADTVATALDKLNDKCRPPVLLVTDVAEKRLLGIVTAFDLL